jgi:ABC-type uncharacterized transport system permease subunit
MYLLVVISCVVLCLLFSFFFRTQPMGVVLDRVALLVKLVGYLLVGETVEAPQHMVHLTVHIKAQY